MAKNKMIKCRICGNEMAAKAKVCPHCGAKNKKPIYKRAWFIALVIIIIAGIFGGSGNSKTVTDKNNSSVKEDTAVKVDVIDFSEMSEEEIAAWGNENNVTITIENVYSDTVADGEFVSQSVEAGNNVKEGGKINIKYSMGEEPSKEYQNALKKAESYSSVMNMSKEGIYDQLTSQYGENFPEDAAEWAMEHLVADYKQNALKKAESYSETMSMSKAGIYDQLTSSYGEKFTSEEAQYAIDNLDADYKKNALEKAKSYRDMMSMSKQSVYDQLVSQYGEKFTAEEAQYAVDHMDD